MTQSARVTICVPVHNGIEFVAETLAAIERQTYPNWTAIVSDDASRDGSAAVCRGFARDPRFRVWVHPSRLGWIGNCNWLLARAEGEFVCIVSHDDLPAPEHIERLMLALSSDPASGLAFSDIQVFGLLDHVEHQESIRGAAAERVRAFIATHFDGTAFHALIRRRALEVAGGLRGNALDHFAADVSWLGRLAQAGGFLRVPEPLYRKRRHAASTSLQWGTWDDDLRAEAWCLHSGELLRDALSMTLTPGEQRAMVDAALRRALAIEPDRPFRFIRDLPRAGRAAIVTAVLNQLRDVEFAGLTALANQKPEAVLDAIIG